MEVHPPYYSLMLNPVRRFSSLALPALGIAVMLFGCSSVAPPPALPSQPEAASGITKKSAVRSESWIAATANPLASEAAAQMLRAGGSAIDATIAAQMVLTLVEPQSSGIGGGAFILHFDAKRRAISAMDGRETAPLAATEALFLSPTGAPLPFHAAAVGGRAVGVPGVVAALQALHEKHGTLPWARLMAPAIALAENGFPVSPRLHTLLKLEPFLKQDTAAAAMFYERNGDPRAVGTIVRNPELARSLQQIAQEGANALRTGPLARAIIGKVQQHPTNPGVLSEEDLARYQPKPRDPLCGAFLRYVVCGMPPPSSGTVAVLQILGTLDALTHERGPAPLVDRQGNLQAPGVHRFSEAGRLAFADRGVYIADPDFVDWPRGLLAPTYLESRARAIDDLRSIGRANAGTPPGAIAMSPGIEHEETGTSHLSIIDAQGNAVSMTTTIEDAFGSRQWVGGFLLNNQLTDFSFAPRDSQGLVANRAQPGKRPRSSMSPLLVFDRDSSGAPGALRLVIGSPGGSQIINYVAKALVATLQDGLDLQSAINLPNIGSRNGPTELEKGQVPQALDAQLAARGHMLQRIDMTSGTQGIMRICSATSCIWEGGADPRREGKVIVP
jgi:gamma-glutamyltranspeptidase/glutathione hydrolase